MLFCLLVVWSCKDFKNWEATYGCALKVKFEAKEDKLVPGVVEDLGSVKLSELGFKHPIVPDSDQNFLLNNDLFIPLNPAADQVSFEIESIDKRYYQKVTIFYKRTRYLISPQAGGLQIKYEITDIQLRTKNNTSAIVKEFTIDNQVPLQKEKDKAHVTLYY